METKLLFFLSIFFIFEMYSSTIVIDRGITYPQICFRNFSFVCLDYSHYQFCDDRTLKPFGKIYNCPKFLYCAPTARKHPCLSSYRHLLRNRRFDDFEQFIRIPDSKQCTHYEVCEPHVNTLKCKFVTKCDYRNVTKVDTSLEIANKFSSTNHSTFMQSATFYSTNETKEE